MKNCNTLIRVGGFINAVFVLFHLWLGWRLHHSTGIPIELRSLLEIFNGCGALFILFLAVVSLFFAAEASSTAIGRLTLWLAVVLYGGRALSEFIVAPKASPAIVATCALTCAVYAVSLAGSSNSHKQPAA